MSELRDPSLYLFPDCVTATIAKAIIDLEYVNNIEYRGISADDPNGTVGFDVIDWQAGEEEMYGQQGVTMPSEAIHLVSIEFLLKHSNEAEGVEQHRRALQEIRSKLYGDATLGVALGQLSRSADGITERMLRWKVMRQQSGSNKINSVFVAMSALEFMFTTEMVPA